MSCKSQRVTTVLALFLIFAVTHVYAGGSFAGSNPGPGDTVAGAPQQQPIAVLTTTGNNPISVNGATAITGATIVNGSLVETPASVPATINIPGYATLDIASNTKFILEDQGSNTRVTLREGCVTLHTKQGTTGEIFTNQGLAGRTNPAKDDVLRVCFQRGAAAPIVDSGAGAAGGGGGTGLSRGGIAAILLGGTAAAVAIALALRGDDPSPSS